MMLYTLIFQSLLLYIPAASTCSEDVKAVAQTSPVQGDAEAFNPSCRQPCPETRLTNLICITQSFI